ncbi:MAG TPA: hypothetical protein VKB09_16565, partial [Thermomicrobiales bacterium]|nr:hypothetical protein [Thermomicrobiales bacterium]
MTTRRTARIEGKIALLGAANHPHAARRLRQSFPALDWFDADAGLSSAHAPSVRLIADSSLPEGAFSLSVVESGSAPAIEIAGGPFSGVIYGVEE